MAKYLIEVEMGPSEYAELTEAMGDWVIGEQKQCGVCENYKPREKFNNQSPEHSRDLISSNCRNCRATRERARLNERKRNGK